MYFYKSLDYLIIYRVLSVNDVEDINMDNLGHHYTLSLDNLDDVTLFDIGIDVDNKLYSIEVDTPITNINLEETIKANVFYPFEQEVYLKKFDNITIQKVKPFKPNN